MDRIADNSGPAGKPRVPDFLRDDKPSGISRQRWERMLRESGLSPAKQRLVREYTSGRRQWPRWTKLILNKGEITDDEIKRLVVSMANPRESSMEEYIEVRDASRPTVPPRTWRQVAPQLLVAGLIIILLGMVLWQSPTADPADRPGTRGQRGSSPSSAPAGALRSTAYLGDPLLFRELLSWENEAVGLDFPEGWVPVVSVFNVDGDEDEEVLAQHRAYVWQNSGGRQTVTGSRLILTILDTTGVVRRMTNPGYHAATRAFAWDWDGDGVSELAVPKDTFSRTEVYDLAGVRLAEIPALSVDALHMLTPQQRMDSNADGCDELLLLDPDLRGIAAYGRDGAETWRPAGFIQFMFATPCDLSGDGYQNTLIDTSLTPFRAFGPELPDGGLELPGSIPGGNAAHSPWAACADLNGDSREELIVPEQGFLDLETAEFTPFDWSVAADRFARTSRNPDGGMYDWGYRLAVGDFTGDGELDIAVTATAANPPAVIKESLLCFFDTQGNATHCEILDALVWETTAIRNGDRDYLVLALSDRVVIYP